MKNAFCGHVIIAPVMEGMNETEIVDMATIYFGEQIARKGAAFAPLLPRERGGDHRTLLGEGKTGGPDRVGEFLSGVFEEIRFVVVGVDLGESTFEKNVDDAFCGRAMMKLLQRTSRRMDEAVSGEQIRSSNGSEAEKTFSQPVAAGGGCDSVIQVGGRFGRKKDRGRCVSTLPAR